MAEQGDQGDVYQVNKLIEIEYLDWSRQLEKAVCGFLSVLISLCFQPLCPTIFLFYQVLPIPSGFQGLFSEHVGGVLCH